MSYTICKAKYAEGKMVVTSGRSTDGWKTNIHWLLEACGGRWVHRSKGYQLSPAQAKTFETLYRNGWEGRARISYRQSARVIKDEIVMSPRQAMKECVL